MITVTITVDDGNSNVEITETAGNMTLFPAGPHELATAALISAANKVMRMYGRPVLGYDDAELVDIMPAGRLDEAGADVIPIVGARCTCLGG